jgi:hypothetical protein
MNSLDPQAKWNYIVRFIRLHDSIDNSIKEIETFLIGHHPFSPTSLTLLQKVDDLKSKKGSLSKIHPMFEETNDVTESMLNFFELIVEDIIEGIKKQLRKLFEQNKNFTPPAL